MFQGQNTCYAMDLGHKKGVGVQDLHHVSRILAPFRSESHSLGPDIIVSYLSINIILLSSKHGIKYKSLSKSNRSCPLEELQTIQ